MRQVEKADKITKVTVLG